jgi:DNA end-binding protein Ku
MHGREHVVVLRPTPDGMVLHTMYFVDELHREKEWGKPAEKKFDKREMDMAKKLIESLAGPFEPDQYHDEYRENVEKLIEAKRKGKKVTPINQPKPAPVIDLMQALQKSLAMSKAGPAAKKSPAPKASRAKKTTKKRATKVA